MKTKCLNKRLEKQSVVVGKLLRSTYVNVILGFLERRLFSSGRCYLEYLHGSFSVSEAINFEAEAIQLRLITENLLIEINQEMLIITIKSSYFWSFFATWLAFSNKFCFLTNKTCLFALRISSRNLDWFPRVFACFTHAFLVLMAVINS